MTEVTDVKASARHVPMSAQKVRLVLDLVRGKSVTEAMDILKFASKASAAPVFKLIRSAVANAEENMGLSRDELYIHEIYADQGATRKWRRFGARGRFKPQLRRSSHITVVLREIDLASV